MKNISSITIKDNINNGETKYSIEISEGEQNENSEDDENENSEGDNNENSGKNKDEKNIKLSTVTISSTKKVEQKLYFYFYENEACPFLYQVDKKDNNDSESTNFVVVERNKSQPILFRDFPLIGSENFHFLFFLGFF